MNKKIAPSELIINPDGSIYHLNLKPEHLAENILFVGDQNRVPKIAAHFDHIEFETQKREFRSCTGSYRGKRFTVLSTGIGPDNIDIVMNELDALVNIDLETRMVKKTTTSLNIVRIGTSGSLQRDIPVDSFVLGTFGLGFDGVLHFYQSNQLMESAMEDAFIEHTGWHPKKARPYIVRNGQALENILDSNRVFKGITATAVGFYGPQGRVLRLPVEDATLNQKIDSFEFQGHRVTNFEMETAAIYGLSKLLGHQACSMNAIIANRADKTASKDPYKVVEELIVYVLDKLAS